MSIQDVVSKRLSGAQVNHAQSFLKPGQIVQGKIVKLFPNNKAQIHIGSQKMIAQLEASLSIGENYHFQVKTNTDVTQLKVIGEQLKDNTTDNMQKLLQELGMKATKAAISLMEQLMRDKIPFDTEQLIKAFQLLEGAANKAQAQSVVKDMIIHKLPVTDSIFQALYTKTTSEFSDQLNKLLLQLKQDANQTPLKQTLIERLASLTEHNHSNKSALIKHILTEIGSNQIYFLEAAKTTELVDKRVNFSSWKTEWQGFAKNNFENVPVQAITLTNQQLTSLVLPFEMISSEVLPTLSKLAENKGILMIQAQVLIQQFSSAINTASIHQIPLATEDFSQLKLQIEKSLLPFLFDRQQQLVNTLLQNNPTSLNQLQTMLKTLSNKQTYAQLEQLGKSANHADNLLVTKPHDQFLLQLKQVLQTTGLAHEFYVANDLPEQQSATIKSMVLQLLQHSGGQINDRAQQLIHYINGMHIHSVNESTNLLQASIQIPGEKLALNKDIQLEFEGKKTESGKIDPAYCRILFYLDLTNLKETVIDMNIQKRAVAITVFNDNMPILDHSHELKRVLKDGLHALDFYLSTITVKPLKQVDMEKETAPRKIENNSYQGVDYRI
ncbi:hypothetical protein [Virgibacillus necropolis]|uniref:Flagellar hook-length control protein-like C-terminal domain-containing protein n=1 Tax=Virgibacillus necropolis TaxID=163877 RepID=A0A221MDQ4_9BACI|nr:hypothetical protein [Virgibacillus necropolis]ASN05742.1 hypothetical protein CFK40_12340 [Virgibacillus necropolis]